MSHNPGRIGDPKLNPYNKNSEKAAIEYEKATANIEKTSKGGGLIQLSELFSSLMNSDNPIIKVLTQFFDMMLTFFNAGGAEAAQLLAEALFDEENVEMMSNMAKAMNTLTKMFDEAGGKVKWFMGILGLLSYTFDELGKSGATTEQLWAGFIQAMINMNSQMRSINLVVNDFKGNIASLRHEIERITDAIEDWIDEIKG